ASLSLPMVAGPLPPLVAFSPGAAGLTRQQLLTTPGPRSKDRRPGTGKHPFRPSRRSVPGEAENNNNNGEGAEGDGEGEGEGTLETDWSAGALEEVPLAPSYLQRQLVPALLAVLGTNNHSNNNEINNNNNNQESAAELAAELLAQLSL
ncbi:unnamed protein product, partial [Polarella glacialis]